MKKIVSTMLAAGVLFMHMSYAEGAEPLAYVKADEPYDYGSEYVYVASDKETGNVIPLSIGPLDGYTYAYLPGREIEIKKVKPKAFTDVMWDWDMYIDEISARGIMQGFDDGTFQKDRIMTRAEAAAVIARLFDLEQENNEAYFDDVPSGSWYAAYAAALAEKGVLNKGSFNPQSCITREQLTVMTCRMLSSMGYIEDKGEYDFSMYRGLDELSEYAKDSYNAMLGNGYAVITDFDEHDFMDTADDEYFLKPQAGVTRYECAEFLYRLIRHFTTANAPALRLDDAPDEEIPVLDGSTSTYDITRNIYSAYYHNAENCPDMPKAHSKTSNAYKRLIDKEVEMIFVPDPSEEIKQYAKEKGVKLRYIPIANEALIFFTSDKNKANNITSQQLYEIYVNNSVADWSGMGGGDSELVPYCRNNDSGSHAQMEKFVLNGKEIQDDVKREHTSWLMSSILTDVDDFNGKNPGKYAIGYSLYYYYLNNNMILGPLALKMLAIDGVNPSEKTIADGTYPYTTNYYAVVRDEKNEKVDAFIELMQSEFGEEIVSMSGLGVIK